MPITKQFGIKSQWRWQVTLPGGYVIVGFSKSETAANQTSRRAALAAGGDAYPDLRYGIWSKSEVRADELKLAQSHGFATLVEYRKAYADRCSIIIKDKRYYG